MATIRIENGWEDALEAVLRERLNALAMPSGYRCMERCAPGEAGGVWRRSGNGQDNDAQCAS